MNLYMMLWPIHWDLHEYLSYYVKYTHYKHYRHNICVLISEIVLCTSQLKRTGRVLISLISEVPHRVVPL